MYYNVVKGMLKSQMENFQFDVVAYDEIEEFNQNIKHSNFSYPYTENKIIIDTIRPKFDSR